MRKCRLLFERSGHARHTLLLPSSERPSSSFDEQVKQKLVIQIRLVGLQELQNGGTETEMQLNTETWLKLLTDNTTIKRLLYHLQTRKLKLGEKMGN